MSIDSTIMSLNCGFKILGNMEHELRDNNNDGIKIRVQGYFRESELSVNEQEDKILHGS